MHVGLVCLLRKKRLLASILEWFGISMFIKKNYWLTWHFRILGILEWFVHVLKFCKLKI
jgi:hypothetical protein